MQQTIPWALGEHNNSCLGRIISFSPQHNTICAITLESVLPFDEMQMRPGGFQEEEKNCPSIPVSSQPHWALTAGGRLWAPLPWPHRQPTETEDAPTGRKCGERNTNFFHNAPGATLKTLQSELECRGCIPTGRVTWRTALGLTVTSTASFRSGVTPLCRLAADQSPLWQLMRLSRLNHSGWRVFLVHLSLNDRAAEWVERGIEQVNLAQRWDNYGSRRPSEKQRSPSFSRCHSTARRAITAARCRWHWISCKGQQTVYDRVTAPLWLFGLLRFVFGRLKKTGVCNLSFLWYQCILQSAVKPVGSHQQRIPEVTMRRHGVSPAHLSLSLLSFEALGTGGIWAGGVSGNKMMLPSTNKIQIGMYHCGCFRQLHSVKYRASSFKYSLPLLPTFPDYASLNREIWTTEKCQKKEYHVRTCMHLWKLHCPQLHSYWEYVGRIEFSIFKREH